MCAAWRCGGLVFRLRCRMVFRLRRFAAFPAHILAVRFFVRASAFSARCVAFCRCGLMLPRLVLFLLFCRQMFLPKLWPHSSAADCCRCKGLFFGLSKRPPFRKWLFGASGIASWQLSGQGRAVPRQGHPEGIIRGVRRSEILLLFIVRNIKFRLKVNLCPDFVSYYLSVGSNVFA